MRTKPQPSRRDEARALFRNSILDAAEHVFAERGFHGARIQDIAEAARTAVGTVYNHFEQKEDLLRALLDERTDGLLAHLQPVPGEPADFEERLTGRIRRILEYVEGHRHFFSILIEVGGLTADPSNEQTKALIGKSAKRMERFRAAFRALITEGVEAGALDENIPATDLAAFLGGTVKASIWSILSEDKAHLADKAAVIVRLFLHGASRPAHRPEARRSAR